MSARNIFIAAVAGGVLTGAAAGQNLMYVIENQNDQLWAVDVTTLEATLVGNLGVDWSFGGLGYNPFNNTMYGHNALNNTLYTVDLNTGAATAIGVDTAPFGLDTFDVNPVTGQGVALGVGSEVWDIDLSNGDATFITDTDSTIAGLASAFDSSGTLFEIDRDNDVLNTIDTGSGAVTPVGGLGFDYEGSSAGYNFQDNSIYVFEHFESDVLWRIDPSDGSSVLLGQVTGFLPSVTDYATQYTSATFIIPAPAGVGLAGLAGLVAGAPSPLIDRTGSSRNARVPQSCTRPGSSRPGPLCIQAGARSSVPGHAGRCRAGWGWAGRGAGAWLWGSTANMDEPEGPEGRVGRPPGKRAGRALGVDSAGGRARIAPARSGAGW